MVFTTLRVMAQVGLYCQYYPECALALGNEAFRVPMSAGRGLLPEKRCWARFSCPRQAWAWHRAWHRALLLAILMPTTSVGMAPGMAPGLLRNLKKLQKIAKNFWR
jgi:hypothetical protein